VNKEILCIMLVSGKQFISQCTVRRTSALQVTRFCLFKFFLSKLDVNHRFKNIISWDLSSSRKLLSLYLYSLPTFRYNLSGPNFKALPLLRAKHRLLISQYKPSTKCYHISSRFSLPLKMWPEFLFRNVGMELPLYAV